MPSTSFIPTTSSYQEHLYSKYIFMSSTFCIFILSTYFIPSTSSYQVHIHTRYIVIPSTSSYQVHLYTKYTFSRCTSPTKYTFISSTLYIFMSSTSLCHVHIHTKYIFLPSTPSYQVHCTYSCQVYLCAMYIVHIYTIYTFKPSTHLRHRWLAAGREALYLLAGFIFIAGYRLHFCFLHDVCFNCFRKMVPRINYILPKLLFYWFDNK